MLDEGCRLEAYQDAGGVWTIGYGCTGPGICKGVVWPQARADAELMKRVQQTEGALQHALQPWFAALHPVRQDVLTNISFNIGVSGLMHWPVTLAAVRQGRYETAAADILGNALWRSQVHERADRCAAAMRLACWP